MQDNLPGFAGTRHTISNRVIGQHDVRVESMFSRFRIEAPAPNPVQNHATQNIPQSGGIPPISSFPINSPSSSFNDRRERRIPVQRSKRKCLPQKSASSMYRSKRELPSMTRVSDMISVERHKNRLARSRLLDSPTRSLLLDHPPRFKLRFQGQEIIMNVARPSSFDAYHGSVKAPQHHQDANSIPQVKSGRRHGSKASDVSTPVHPPIYSSSQSASHESGFRLVLGHPAAYSTDMMDSTRRPRDDGQSKFLQVSGNHCSFSPETSLHLSIPNSTYSVNFPLSPAKWPSVDEDDRMDGEAEAETYSAYPYEADIY